MDTSPMTTVALRLGPGQDLKRELDAFVKRNNLAAVSVLTCVGSLTRVPLRYANQERYEVLTGHFEIVSLTGMLSAQSGSHCTWPWPTARGAPWAGTSATVRRCIPRPKFCSAFCPATSSPASRTRSRATGSW